MPTKKYQLTREQKALLQGIKRLAKEQGLETKTIVCPINKTVHRAVSDFLKRLDSAEKATKNSKLTFTVGYQGSYAQQNPAYAT